MKTNQGNAIHVLLVDDEEGILELYQKVLNEAQRARTPGRMGQLAAQLFGRRVEGEPEEMHFDLTFARQAQDAIRQVEKALNGDNPFAVIFLDIRMPPGPDGVWAAEQIRQLDPNVEIILVTGFSDIDPKEIARRVPPLDKLLYIEKPFFPQEIRHFACSLGVKWQTARELYQVKGDLEKLVKQRTSELEETNSRLLAQIAEHERTEMLREFRNNMLEQLAAGSRLTQVVSTLLSGIERICPDIVLAILLPNQDDTYLSALPAPGLPDYFLEAMKGVPIAPDEPCVGKAAFERKAVFLDHIVMTHGEDDDLCHLARRAGFVACLARPILSEKSLLGVLCAFFAESREPSPFEERLFDSAVQLATIAIKRYRDERNLNKLLAAVEQNPTALMITSPNGVVEYINSRYTELTGYAAEEVVGKVADLLHVSGRAGEAAHTRFALVNKGLKWEEDMESISRDGKVYKEHVIISGIKGRDDNNSHLLVMRQDVSDRHIADEERKQLESRLLQAQKMETIGTLAGGIAHDFNNMLTPILGYTEMAMQEVDGDSCAHKHLSHVIRASGRAKELVQQMLTFSRRGQSEREPIKINFVVNEAIKLLRSSFPTTIRIKFNIDEDCGLVKANPTQLIQVMMNLCANAKHAMREKGGVIQMNLVKKQIREDQTKTLKPGAYGVLTIADSGHGISPSNLVRVFEPFFTTKEAGEGTGLGLSVVHGIITAHDGDISVESKENLGTTFTIYLPLTNEEALPITPEEAAQSGKLEHILFVDDEEMIVQMTAGMLERQGYVITACTDPRDAFQHMLKTPEKFDLLITDQTMPHLTGVDLAARVLALRPELPIILLTGFSESVNEENCAELGIREFLMKPMSTSEMSRAIRKVLDN